MTEGAQTTIPPYQFKVLGSKVYINYIKAYIYIYIYILYIHIYNILIYIHLAL